tara:strand:- start:2234 stop:3700 length:1467 start_codon:yes stop_codon:yes gene_type:complete
MKSLIYFFAFIIITLSSCGDDPNNDKTTDTAITIISPEPESIVQDSITILCESNNNNLVMKVELWIDNDSTEISDYNAPFELHLNTINYTNGEHEIFIRLYDIYGNKFDSETIIWNFSNFLMFSRTIGEENSSEVGHSIIQLQDSSFIILGSINDDILLTKTNRLGEKQWQQSIGGSQLDKANHIQSTSDGGYIISGETQSYGSGGNDIWLIKTNQSGLMEWNNCLGTINNEQGGQALETQDGGFILVGGKTISNNGNNNVWLVKTNSQGDTLWTKSFGGTESDNGTDLLIDDNGGFVILGSTESYGNGGEDIYLIKTDINGNEEWSKTYGSGSNDRGQSLIKTPEGGYLVRYIIESFGAGNTSVGLLKVSQNGDQIWTKTIGGSYGISSNSLQKISNGNYIMICSLFNYGYNSFNAYLLQFNETGNIIWDVTWGHRENDHGLGVLQTKDGGFVITGSTNNYGNSDQFSSDLLLLKTNASGLTININN